MIPFQDSMFQLSNIILHTYQGISSQLVLLYSKHEYSFFDSVKLLCQAPPVNLLSIIPGCMSILYYTQCSTEPAQDCVQLTEHTGNKQNSELPMSMVAF